MVKDPSIRAELALLKELELVGQDIRRGKANWARIADVLRINPYLNITKGLVCDAAMAGNGKPLGGSLVSSVGPGSSIGPYGDQNAEREVDAESVMEVAYQFQASLCHWRAGSFAPTDAHKGDTQCQQAGFVLLQQWAE